MDRGLKFTIINSNIKTTGQANYELVQVVVGMGTTTFLGWNIVKVKNTFYVEGDVIIALDKRQVTPWVIDFWQGNNLTVIYSWIFFHEKAFLEKLL